MTMLNTVFNNFMGDYDRDNYQTDPMFAPYLTSNDPIPQDILDTLQSVLIAPRNSLQDLERTVRVLRITLKTVERRHACLQNALSVYDPLLSPIRRLPDHMLGEIFYHCLPTDKYPGLSITESPLLLTMVCKKWRSLAHNTPLLWNRMRIWYYPHVHERQNPKQHEASSLRNMAIERWLLRSGDSCPLSFALNSYGPLVIPDPPLQPDDTTSQTFALIAKYADRISDVELHATVGVFIALERAITSSETVHTLPILHSLKLYIAHHPTQSITASTLFFTSASPSLRYVSISSDTSSSMIDVMGPRTRWNVMTRLFFHAEQMDIGLALDLVSRCLSLEALSINVESGSQSSSPPPTSHLPNLTTLHIHGTYSGAAKFCSFIDAPVVTHALLNLISPSESEQPRPPRGLAGLLERAPVSTLTINPTLLSPIHVQSILEAVPKLTSLIIDQSFFTQPDNHGSIRGHHMATILALFAAQGDKQRSTMSCLFNFQEDRPLVSCNNPSVDLNGPLLPDLRSLTIMEATGSSFVTSVLPDVDILLSFIKSRIHAQNEDKTNTTASLEFIKLMFLPRNSERHAQGIRTTDTRTAVNIETSIAQHVLSVGRRVGVDLMLQVFYARSLSPSASFLPIQ